MNKKFSTLLAGVALFGATSAFAGNKKVCRNTRCAFFFSLTIKIGSFF